jgi:hypothetical protein
VALMIWAVTVVGIVPLGLALAFHEGLNWKRLRQLEKDAVAIAEDDVEVAEAPGESPA